MKQLAQSALLGTTWAVLRRMSQFLELAAFKGHWRKQRSWDATLDEYAPLMPCAQNAVDLLPGWKGPLPDHAGARGGPGIYAEDARILWAIEQACSLDGCKILELGPCEAQHTYLLERSGAALVDAIEPNKLAYLRCLVVKELLDLRHANFFLGDYIKWLEKPERHYDLVIACAILERAANSISLLELIAQSCSAFYLWTHYASKDMIESAEVRATGAQECRGRKIPSYTCNLRAGKPHMQDGASLLSKDDLLTLIRTLGFSDIRTAHEEPAQAHNPSFSIFARRVEYSSRFGNHSQAVG